MATGSGSAEEADAGGGCGAPRPGLRADAERNRQAIVCAAASSFAEQGSDVPMEEVARRAGVGVATLYRRFPSRDELIEAVLAAKMREFADRAEAAAERALVDPWGGLSAHVRQVMEMQAGDPALADALIGPVAGSTLFAAEHRRAIDATVVLVDRAKAAGVVRPDLDHSDLFLLAVANAGLVHLARTAAPEGSRRLGALFLDAIRPLEGREPLPRVPAEWARIGGPCNNRNTPST
ncbi:TetR/AcrR family transcriptional regulator [Cellulomonas timonensis]|uniref:TetR/AcrR family transcriptional regulator n=1 Tax=Cellulomonas timonensis TaxID=1689271 RepID=UPI0008344C8D|nr:TetR/AcrR family transcriptional regulator [Cellulomonas timonensis]